MASWILGNGELDTRTQSPRSCGMMRSMKLSRTLRKAADEIEAAVEASSTPHSSVLRTVSWVTAGVAALTVGVIVGRELRERYKFNRRTPYDFYAHSGDQGQDIEFGVGI